jgi:hypothetical protein
MVASRVPRTDAHESDEHGEHEQEREEANLGLHLRGPRGPGH